MHKAALNWLGSLPFRLRSRGKGIAAKLGLRPFMFLRESVIELNSVQELKKVFDWTLDPILDRPDLHDFDYIEDVNERRVRDAEALATVMRNARPAVAVEIGTSTGLGTVLMAANAPSARIYTINIPPEELEVGAGGKLTTVALSRDEIGKEYRRRGLSNIVQILANTATWKPDIGTIDVAFIDGAHDTRFVVNDTLKILRHMRAGGFILWHDFNLALVDQFDWIGSVCAGVEQLYRRGILRGRIFHLRDSWVGIHRIQP